MASRPRTVMERAYSEIKKKVMTLQLAPGSVIDDLGISEELGISRTPAREALFRLVSEGLMHLSRRCLHHGVHRLFQAARDLQEVPRLVTENQ